MVAGPDEHYLQTGTAHDRDECIPGVCLHPDHEYDGDPIGLEFFIWADESKAIAEEMAPLGFEVYAMDGWPFV